MDRSIKLTETETGGQYSYRQDNGPVANLTFSKAGQNLIIIDHTDVPDAYRGQGVGLKLVKTAVDDARASGKKIIPLCPFARATFSKHAEWYDVWSGKD